MGSIFFLVSYDSVLPRRYTQGEIKITLDGIGSFSSEDIFIKVAERPPPALSPITVTFASGYLRISPRYTFKISFTALGNGFSGARAYSINKILAEKAEAK